MKRFIILSSILLIASLGLMSALAKTADSLTNPLQELDEPTGIVEKVTEIGKKFIDAKSKAPANPIADPNKVKDTLANFEGLEKQLEEVDKKSEDEIRQWLQGDTDNKIELTKEAHEQVWAEIMLIREFAVEENAAKTTAAIDGILLNRQERFDKINDRLNDKLQQEKKELRRTRSTRTRRSSRQRSSQDRRYRN